MNIESTEFLNKAFLKENDKIAIVSLSSGVLGENFCQHQLEHGQKRLASFSHKAVCMPHALKGIEYVKNHPDKKIIDWVEAFLNPNYSLILSAIGGIDAIYSVPYLLEHKHLCQYIQSNPKPYLGFSDSTVNHLVLYKMGICSFYGQSFLTCLAELDSKMLPYSEKSFRNFYQTEPWIYEPVDKWYEERENFSANQLNTSRKTHEEKMPWILLQGSADFSGHLWGGCIEVLADALLNEQEKAIYEKYQLLPTREELAEAVVFLETAEVESALKPEKLKEFLLEIKNRKMFDQISGLIIGTPQNKQYFNEYQKIYKEVFKNDKFSILYNLPFGHAYPKMILQYGALANISATQQRLTMYPRKILNEKKANEFLDKMFGKSGKSDYLKSTMEQSVVTSISKPKQKVVAGLLWENNQKDTKFLIAQRPYNKTRGLLWEFVGGKVEKNETSEQALLREFAEELALEIEVSSKLLQIDYEYDDMIMEFELYEVRKIAGNIQMLEHNNLQYINQEEIENYIFCDGCAPIFDKLFKK